MFELQQELSMLQKRSLKQHEASDRIHKILKGLGLFWGVIHVRGFCYAQGWESLTYGTP